MNKHRSKTYGGELIGKHVKVLRANDYSQIGISGTVVDESKNMLRIDIGTKLVLMPKAYSQLSISDDKKDGMVIMGEAILGRPEDRISRAM